MNQEETDNIFRIAEIELENYLHEKFPDADKYVIFEFVDSFTEFGQSDKQLEEIKNLSNKEEQFTDYLKTH